MELLFTFIGLVHKTELEKQSVSAFDKHWLVSLPLSNRLEANASSISNPAVFQFKL